MINLTRLAVSLIVAGALVTVTPVAAQAVPLDKHHWNESTVYVENHAGSRWPVRKAAENLDNGSSLDLVVVDRCPAGKPCVKVYDVASIPGRTVGREQSTSWGDRTYSSKITLDDGWGREASKRKRLTAVCHELGHAVGLAHTSSRGSCMFENVSKASTKISKAQRRALNRIY